MGRKVWTQYFKFTVDRNPWDRIVSQYYWRTPDLVPRPSLSEYIAGLEPQELSNWHLYSIRGELAVDGLLKFETVEADLAALYVSNGWPQLDELPQASRHIALGAPGMKSCSPSKTAN